MKIMKAFLFFIVILLLSCSTPGKTVKETDPAQVNNEDYKKKGLALLLEPNDERFFNFINSNPPILLREQNELIDQYIRNQEVLVNYFRDRSNFMAAYHYFKNLYAVKNLSEAEISQMEQKLFDEAARQEWFAFLKFLNMKKGTGIGPEDTSPLLPVTEYNRYITEITVKREYVNRDKSVRTENPGIPGTGIAVDQHHILTTFSLVENIYLGNTRSYSITVKQGDQVYTGVTVLSADSLIDLALLETTEEIDAPQAFYKLLGDSSSIRRGQEIYTLGHHSGYASSLTKGIVSAEKRISPEAGEWIQIDAPASIGGNGGLLIGEDGLVYGMITGGLAHENISFAVPSSHIMEDIDRLMRRIEIKRPWLGLLLGTLMDSPGKVFIRGIFPSSPLAGSGIAPMNQLVSINGIPVTSAIQAREIISFFDADNIVRLNYIGDEGEKSLYTILKRRPDYPLYSNLKSMDRIESLYLQFGFSLDPRSRKIVYQTIKKKVYRFAFYRVTAVEKDSVPEKMGVQADDTIGILSDYYSGNTRYVDLFHIPKDPKLRNTEYVDDYIYHLSKEGYDENIL